MLALCEREGFFEGTLEGACHETVLRFARVVLTLSARRLELGALPREALQTNPLLVLAVEMLDRARGRVHAGRSDGRQERIGHGAIKAQAADRLARTARPLKLMGTRAQIPGRAPVRARIGDHHAPPALPAPQQPLEQRAALARGAPAYRGPARASSSSKKAGSRSAPPPPERG